MKMKVMNITDIDKFFGTIDRCEGKVELVTDNGDIYNLKSKLGQFASLTKVCFNGKIPVVELVTYYPSDAGKIMILSILLYTFFSRMFDLCSIL